MDQENQSDTRTESPSSSYQGQERRSVESINTAFANLVGGEQWLSDYTSSLMGQRQAFAQAQQAFALAQQMFVSASQLADATAVTHIVTSAIARDRAESDRIRKEVLLQLQGSGSGSSDKPSS